MYPSLVTYLRYAPLYYPDYSIEINSGSQFLFSITYADATDGGQKSKGKTYVHGQMSKDDKNVQGEMSKENVQELSDEELSLKPFESKRSKDKKKRRIQAIMGMIAKDSHVSLEAMANQLDVSTKTVWRDISESQNIPAFFKILPALLRITNYSLYLCSKQHKYGPPLTTAA